MKTEEIIRILDVESHGDEKHDEALDAAIGRLSAFDDLLASAQMDQAHADYVVATCERSIELFPKLLNMLQRNGWDGFQPTSRFITRFRAEAIAKGVGAVGEFPRADASFGIIGVHLSLSPAETNE